MIRSRTPSGQAPHVIGVSGTRAQYRDGSRAYGGASMRRQEARELYPSVTSRVPAPCGTYTHLHWPARVFGFTGFHAFEWDVTPERDTAHGYFWAHQFAFRRSG